MSVKTINKDKRRPHALLMPLPFQGHIIPAVHIAIKLASKGMTITFVNTEDNHHRISSASKATGDIFADARATGLDIRYEVVGDGLPVDFDRSLHQDEFVESYRGSVPTNVEALVKRLMVDGALFTCFIVDTFFDWPAAMAKKFGVPYVSFWTESALVLTLYYHVYLLEQNGHFGSLNGNRTDMITYIPGVDEIAPSDLMSYLQDRQNQTFHHEPGHLQNTRRSPQRRFHSVQHNRRARVKNNSSLPVNKTNICSRSNRSSRIHKEQNTNKLMDRIRLHPVAELKTINLIIAR